MNQAHSCDVEVIIVGAGVIGLAIGAAIAEAGHSVFILERHEGPGRETSSRNSEVIHAGLYYPPGSLKARLCVEGNRRLYDFCSRFNINCRRIGKLIVAVEENELAQIKSLFEAGTQNGAPDLHLCDQSEVKALEPNIRAVGALYSGSTGIIDSHNLIKTLEGQTTSAGGQIVYRAKVIAVDQEAYGYCVTAKIGSADEKLRGRAFINCAGLESDRLAAIAGINKYQLHWCKGDYFAASGKIARLVSHLIYPVPTSHLTSLGTHITLDLAGRMRLGPDATYVDRNFASLEVDETKASFFCESARRFLPELKIDDLHPDLAGIRPKLQGPGETFCDFVITEEIEMGKPGFFNLIGIESPGLTSSLAIADYLLPLVAQYLA